MRSSPLAPEPGLPARVLLDSIPIDPLSLEQTLRWIGARARAAEPMALIATVNADFLRLARKEPGFAELLRQESTLNVIDGWPVAALVRLAGVARVPRAPGSDLTRLLLTEPEHAERGVFLLGDTGETLAAVRARGAREGWSHAVRGAYSPSRVEVDDDARSLAIVEQINASGARVLLVAFGAPRQERWLVRWRHRLAPAVGIGVGGSFKFVASPDSRAPEWMRSAGLEWAHRLASEPRRLGGRYAADAAELARLTWRVSRRRADTRPDGPSADDSSAR